MSRFSGHPYPGGLFVLDTWTGEVVKVPEDGSPPQLLRPAVAPAHPPAGPTATGRPPLEEPARERALAPTSAPTSAPSTGTASWTALDHEVVSSFPYPIARTYRSYLTEPDPRQRCKLLVDTFTHVIKLWALQTASEYSSRPDLEDSTVDHTLSRDFQRPLISAWNLMLARALPVLVEHEADMLAPELVRAYRQLESHCRDKVSIETPYKDADGVRKVRTSKLGRIQALIKYRNSLAHGYNQSRTQAERDLRRFAPVLCSVLEQARFSTRYPLYHAPSPPAADGTMTAYRLMGAAPAAKLEQLATTGTIGEPSPLFLHDPSSGRVLPLLLFLDVEDVSDDPGASAIPGLDWDVLTFEGHTRTSVIYVSVSGHHVEKQGQLARWRALLAQKSSQSRSLTLHAMKWQQLKTAADRECTAVLHTVKQSGRYIPEVAVPRPLVERLLDDFERSDYRAFVVAGDNGIGKSTILARYAESRRDAGDLGLFYRAAGLRDTQLSHRILRDLGIRNAFFEDFLAALQERLPEGARVRIIVDSLHEHPSATHDLTRAIDALVEQAASYPFVRVLTSIRTVAYERLPPDARLGRTATSSYFTVEDNRGATTQRTLLITVPPMSPVQVAEAYERYRTYRRPDELADDGGGVHVFRPTTRFEELNPDGATVALLRVPLFMRLLLSAYAFKPLPANLSFEEAMEPYMNEVVVERDEPSGGYPERRRFLLTLVALLDQENAEGLPRDRLYQVPKLAAHLTNPQKDSAYVQLLELGILIEDWDDDVCSVRFAFDGLFEHLLATLHYPRLEGPRDLLVLVERALSFKSLAAAAVGIMRRAIRSGRHAMVLDACDMCPVADDPDHSEPASLMLMAMLRDLLVDLARFRDPGFALLCNEIASTISRFDALTVSAAFDTLFTMGEIPAATRLAELGEHLAEELADPGLHARALLRRAKIDQLRGQTDQAFPRLLKARALAGSADDQLLCHRIDLFRGRLLEDTGHHAQAQDMYRAAHRGLVEVGELGDASSALRGLASIAASSEQLARAEQLNRTAIELAEEARDPSSMAKALNNLAMVQTRRGDSAGALASFQRSLAIKSQLGDRASIAINELNLGMLHYERGEQEAAGRRLRSALATFESLQHAVGSGLVLCNLGLLGLLADDDERAADLLERSIALFTTSGYQRGLAHAVWLRASLELDRGHSDSARSWIERQRELAQALGTKKPLLQSLALSVRAAALAGAPGFDELLRELCRDSEAVDALTWEVEEGPAGAFLDAARHLREQGQHQRASELVEHVRQSVGTRPFARAPELMEPPSEA